MEPLNLTVEAEGQITHTDGTTETVKMTDTVAFGLNLDADGEVTHANPELWDGNQMKEQ
jgi:hypothetical protein